MGIPIFEESDDSVNEVLRGYIKKSKIYSWEKYNELLRRAKKGDERAREQFIGYNMRLVIKIAKLFSQHKKLPNPDHIQAGVIGLIRAIDRYNENGRCKFSTYARWLILQEIIEWNEKSHSSGTSLHMRKLITTMKEEIGTNEDGIAKMSLQELAEKSNRPYGEIVEIFNAPVETTSIDKRIADDSESYDKYEVIPDDDTSSEELLEEKTRRNLMLELIDRRITDETQNHVIKNRLGFSGLIKGCPQLAKEYGVKKQCIAGKQKTALEKLSKPGEDAVELRRFLGIDPDVEFPINTKDAFPIVRQLVKNCAE